MVTKAAALPRLYLGTMTFGWSQASTPVDTAAATTMLRRFIEAAGDRQPHHVDTARIYASGDTEPIVGAAIAATGTTVFLGSKAHPSQPGGLSADGLRSQLAASLDALGVQKLDELYLHQPDPATPLLESLRTTDAMVREGVVGKIGLSNYHASEVARAFALCKEHGLTPPTVYQGLYNPLNRLVEDELLPVLRENGCAFVAYNPLAAGLLTGRHTPDTEVAPGRFKDNPNYMPRFYTPVNFDALGTIRAACEAAGISLVEATYRWLLCHSALKGDGPAPDGLLLGASSVAQLEANLAACAAARTAEPLPMVVRAAMEGAWSARKLRADAFPYWRSYSGDMPGRDELPQGASYSAAKK